MTVAELQREAGRRLASVSDSPAVDAALLMCRVRGCDRARLIVDGNAPITDQDRRHYESLVGRRLDGEPIAYLTGEREFWSLPLKVSDAVLVPRPETERLVELALERLEPQRPSAVLDLGTGSGAIALALAHERPEARVTAVDASAEALTVARDNAASLGLTVEWLHGDWYAPVGGRRFALILSNPPYVDGEDPHLLALRHEPRAALVAGDGGMACLRRIIAESTPHLEPGGWLLLEHGARQGAAVRGQLLESGFDAVETFSDLAGLDRVSGGRRA